VQTTVAAIHTCLLSKIVISGYFQPLAGVWMGMGVVGAGVDGKVWW